jgi:hypothetical protein
VSAHAVAVAEVVAADAATVAENLEVDQESLTERMARGRLPLADALRYATQIATSLRDMHLQRLVYGAVSSQLILLGPRGATLRSSGGLTHLGEGRDDVQAFGAVLGEMLRGIDGPEELRVEMGTLATCCQQEAPDMQQVLITLRLLGLRLRQGAALRRTPMLACRPKVAAKPRRKFLQGELVLQWLDAARQWKPLANLGALAWRVGSLGQVGQ